MAKALKPRTKRGDGTVDKKGFDDAVKSIRAHKGKLGTASANLQNVIKRYCGDDSTLGLDTKALKLAISVADMDPARRSAFLQNLDNYNHMIGNYDQTELPLAGKKESDPDPDAPKSPPKSKRGKKAAAAAKKPGNVLGFPGDRSADAMAKHKAGPSASA